MRKDGKSDCSFKLQTVILPIKITNSILKGAKMKDINIKNSQQLEVCESEHKHSDLIEKVRGSMPSTDDLYDLAELFKVFGDSTRIRILYVLFESEMCVCDIAATLDMTVSAISHQLRVLRSADLVRSRRTGKSVIYYLADDHVRKILCQGMEHITE